LSGSASGQGFKPISRRNGEVLQGFSGVNLFKLPFRSSANVIRNTSGRAPEEHVLGPAILERTDCHAITGRGSSL
jgi:hypothetical protein